MDIIYSRKEGVNVGYIGFNRHEKCRKMGAILVKTARIRVKVFRECYSSTSRLEFEQMCSL